MTTRWTTPERRHQSRVLAGLFGSAAALSLLVIGAGGNGEGAAGSTTTGSAAAASAGVLAVLVLLFGERMGRTVTALTTAVGSVLIGSTQLLAGGGSATFAVLYVLVAVHPARFFAAPVVAGQLAWSTLVHGAVVHTQASGGVDLRPVVLTLGTQVVMAVVVRSLADQLRRTAETDPLTGLANRRTLDRELVASLDRSYRHPDRPTSLAILDFDDFKHLNDTRGHVAGDRALTAAANAWRTVLRPSDTLARLGGDEFVVVMPDTSEEQAEGIVRRLLAACPEQPPCSAGVACWDGVEGPQGLVERADAALYAAKVDGPVQRASAKVGSPRDGTPEVDTPESGLGHPRPSHEAESAGARGDVGTAVS